RAKVVPAHVMEFASYHAIVACVAAGAGIALVPRSVIRAVPGGSEVAVYPLPADTSRTRTMLVWRAGERSAALDALRRQLDARSSMRAGSSRRSVDSERLK